MPYTTTRLIAARSALSQRLADPLAVRWTAAELDAYLREALRTWNAYTSSYRARGAFLLESPATWYALPTVLPDLRGQTLTNYDLQADIAYALLEPVPTTTWTGTTQFTLADITAAITRRRDQFLRDTGAILTRAVVPVAASPVGRVALPSTTLRVRRAAWISSWNEPRPLVLTDEWQTTAQRPRWPQQPARPPAGYSVSVTPSLVLQLLPPPLDGGSLELLSVDAGGSLAPDAARTLGIPDDWAWVVKWGALADLLGRDGLALDPARAAYCQARWQQGIAAAAAAPVVIGATINNQPVQVDGVLDADRYRPQWQAVSGVPERLLVAGQNLVGCLPPPGVPIGGGGWGASLDVVANIPVPSADADYVQIDAGQYDALLDYAQYLALFKQGPQALAEADALLQRFAAEAGVTLTYQQGSQPSRRPLLEQQAQDDRSQPAALPVAGGAAIADRLPTERG